ncbi:MAG: hypothetical protein M3R00_03925 [Pseudomonadota bacterium]|nr:hypothetical protein [Pseudomonadota bacterium]
MKLDRLSRANDVSFSNLSAMLPEILVGLPNDQIDIVVQGADLPQQLAFDVRGQEIKSGHVMVYGKYFSNLVRFGAFVYAVSEKIVGLTHLGGLLFVQPNPTRPFERLLDSQSLQAAKLANNAPIVWADKLLDIGGFQYMKTCFEYASRKANDALPVLLVLGGQHADGRDENLEPYVCRKFAVLRDKVGNIHQYDFDETAKNAGLIQGVNIFHVNIPAFENQIIDSPDIEKLYEIYTVSMGSKRPLMIHCTDGMDRAGGISFAFHLLHNWRRIFNEQNPKEILKNILTEHDLMQQLRGPSFCTAYDRRLHAAVQLAMLMRSVQMCTEIYLKDKLLSEQLKTKTYLQQLYILEKKKTETGFFSPNESELLVVLQARVALESHYFEEFAEGLQHPQVSMWQYDQLLQSADVTKEQFQSIKQAFINNGSMDAQLDMKYRQLLIQRKLSSVSGVHRDEIDLRLKIIAENNDNAIIKLRKIIALTLELDALNLIKSIERFPADNAVEEELKGIKQFLARNMNLFESTKKMKATIRKLVAINDKLLINQNAESATKQRGSTSGLDLFYSRLTKISPRLSARYSSLDNSGDETAASKPVTRARSNSVSPRGSASSVVSTETPEVGRGSRSSTGKDPAIDTADPEQQQARSKTLLSSKASMPISLKAKAKANSHSHSLGSIEMLPMKSRNAKSKDNDLPSDEDANTLSLNH